jgi:hypothetical protein
LFLREIKRKYIRLKYENHKFVANQFDNGEKINNLIKIVQENDQKKLFEMLLQLFGQNYDLLAPLDLDVNTSHWLRVNSINIISIFSLRNVIYYN